MWLNLAVVTGLMMLAVVVHLPVLQEPFGTNSLTLGDWAVVVAVAFSVVPVLEAAKLVLRRRAAEDAPKPPRV
jgi:Ca2+-transporting ATPase